MISTIFIIYVSLSILSMLMLTLTGQSGQLYSPVLINSNVWIFDLNGRIQSLEFWLKIESESLSWNKRLVISGPRFITYMPLNWRVTCHLSGERHATLVESDMQLNWRVTYHLTGECRHAFLVESDIPLNWRVTCHLWIFLTVNGRLHEITFTEH